MAEHDELLARRGIRIGTVTHDGKRPQIWYNDKPIFGPDDWDEAETTIVDFCAAIRSDTQKIAELEGKLEAERNSSSVRIAELVQACKTLNRERNSFFDQSCTNLQVDDNEILNRP